MAWARRVAWLLMLIVGCGDGNPAMPDAGIAQVDAGPVAQGGTPSGDLIINEVHPRPVEGEDWLELYNRAEVALDLCDFFVTDNLGRLDHYLALGGAAPPEACEPLMLAPGAYVVVTADNAPEVAGHAPFKLGAADEVHVVTSTGIPVDSLVYLYVADSKGVSLARIPDGKGLFYTASPTPGARNPEVVQ